MTDGTPTSGGDEGDALPSPEEAVGVSRRRVAVFVAVAAALVGGLVAFAVESGSSSAGYDITPDAFALPTLTGTGRVALAKFAGRPVVVNFFASWCTVCATELPLFGRTARALRGQVDFVEVDALETGNGAAFARRFDLAGAVLARDVGGSQGDGLYHNLNGTGAMPDTAFYSSTGQPVLTFTGGFTAARLSAQLHSLYGVTVAG